MKGEITIREYLESKDPDILVELESRRYKQDLKGYIRTKRNIIKYWIKRWSAIKAKL